jgi:uncharacterized protein YjbJ (UPF0337 family)
MKEKSTMILFSKARKFLLIISLVLLMVTFTAFASESSVATTLLNKPISLDQIASMNRVEAITKDIEGKVQEGIGNVTGDKKDQFMGKMKQEESKARHTIEDIKDADLQQQYRTTDKNAKETIEDTIKKVMNNGVVNPN